MIRGERQEKESDGDTEIGKPGGTQGCKVIFEESACTEETHGGEATDLLLGANLGCVWGPSYCCSLKDRDAELSHEDVRLPSDSGSGPDTWESPCQLCVDWCMNDACKTQASATWQECHSGFSALFLRAQATLPCVLASQNFSACSGEDFSC